MLGCEDTAPFQNFLRLLASQVRKRERELSDSQDARRILIQVQDVESLIKCYWERNSINPRYSDYELCFGINTGTPHVVHVIVRCLCIVSSKEIRA